MSQALPVLTRPAEAASPRRRTRLWLVLGFVFVAGVLLLQALGRGTEVLRTVNLSFVSIVLEALPFVMLGSLIGGVIEVFLSREKVTALLPKRRWLAAPAAAAMGVLMPVCECAVIPVTRRLMGKGVPVGAAVAYLLAGPIVNPLVAGSTAVAYAGDWAVVAARLGFAYLIAVVIGLVMGRLFPGAAAMREGGLAATDHDHCHDHDDCCGDDPQTRGRGDAETRGDADFRFTPVEPGHSPILLRVPASPRPRVSFPARLHDVLLHASDDFLYVGQFLIVGAFFAALSQSFIDRSTFVRLAETPAVASLLMMGLAVALNLCSEADAFVAASFRGTLPLSAQLAFLILGPMLDLKLIAMYSGLFRKRFILTLVGLIAACVFTAAMVIHYGLVGRGVLTP